MDTLDRHLTDEEILERVEELEKLNLDERWEVLSLWHTFYSERTPEQQKRWMYLSSQINWERFHYQTRRETVKKTHIGRFKIIDREEGGDWVLRIINHSWYNVVLLPQERIPDELKKPPVDANLDPDYLEARVRVNLDNQEFISFEFLKYCRRFSRAELIKELSKYFPKDL